MDETDSRGVKALMKAKRDLLVVDGYNVIYKSRRYTKLIDKGSSSGRVSDPHIRARELLVGDVAAYAQGRFDPIVVFDGAGNVNEGRSVLRMAGVPLIFSKTNQTADTVIEKLVTEAREQGRKVTVVTSDNTIRATVGAGGVTRVSADMFASNIKYEEKQTKVEAEERCYAKLTLADRLSAEDREKINRMLGRS